MVSTPTPRDAPARHRPPSIQIAAEERSTVVKKQLTALIAIVPLTLGLAACGGSSDSDKTVKIAISEHNDVQDTLQKEAEKQGITVEYEELGDYNKPNPALSQGQVDLNWFQTIAYLANYNVDNDDDLQMVGPTAIYPLGLYSKKYDKLADLPQGAQVAVPNDNTNETRAILVLKAAGLLTLKNDKAQPTQDDVDTAKSKVKLTPVEAKQTVLSLDSVDAAIVNNTFLGDAGLDPKSALYQDSASSDEAKPYVNMFTAKKGEEDDETYKKIVDIYHSDAVQEAEKKQSGGTAVAVSTDQTDQLREVQTKLEDERRNDK